MMKHGLANPKFIIDVRSNSPYDKTFCLTLNTDLMMEYVARPYMGA
jgi:hypothetical protein